ncbi:hypothetical protein PTUN_a4051 [Pseudoalteromonas tunicata]|jgi:hypothetical protein|uniref:Uncharacterized protein n=1 Tax=Pseudoalteromonas tunicata D2 TaxID=87626 RepID=A4CE33_9GAMM|nr:hypothetical protein PTUN_a4051 [Pseudoalteromonas tunicata]EAR27225.1 hypothetical protein PTD2_06125 [Pseudoalteromonas tunicata D2]
MTPNTLNSQDQSIKQVTKSTGKRARFISKLNSYGSKLGLANAVRYK